MSEPEQSKPPEATPNPKSPFKRSDEVAKFLDAGGGIIELLLHDKSKLWKQILKRILSLKTVYILAVGIVVWWLTAHFYAKDVRAVQTALSNTNAFFSGTIKEKDSTIQTLERTVGDEREAKRQKDSTIQQLITEKSSLEERLAFFNSIPERTLALYTNLVNAASNQPTQLSQLTQAFTNFINSMEEERPRLEVRLNGEQLQSWKFYSIGQTRELHFYIRNVSQISADRVALDLQSTEVFGTNWIAKGWETPGRLMHLKGDNYQEAPGPVTYYSFSVQRPIAGKSTYEAHTIKLSTNVDLRIPLELEVTISAIKARTETFRFFIEE